MRLLSVILEPVIHLAYNLGLRLASTNNDLLRYEVAILIWTVVISINYVSILGNINILFLDLRMGGSVTWFLTDSGTS